MALSDSCSDALTKLAKALVHYTDNDEYDKKSIVEVIGAMYNLATATSAHDTHGTPYVNVELGIHRVVLGAIFDAKLEDDKHRKADNISIIKLLADVSNWHSRLHAGINAVDAEITNNPNSIMNRNRPGISMFIKDIIKLQ